MTRGRLVGDDDHVPLPIIYWLTSNFVKRDKPEEAAELLRKNTLERRQRLLNSNDSQEKSSGIALASMPAQPGKVDEAVRC